MAAGWIFHSGRIFDGLRVHPAATAVAVADGVITAVGTDADVRAAAGPDATAVDLRGRLLAPGLHRCARARGDGGAGAAGLRPVRLCRSRCRAGAGCRHPRLGSGSAASGSGWITGGGWHKADFPGGYPTREMLDAVVPDRPVYLVNADHHSAWVNSRALELAGIDAATADPEDGLLERDADGFPSGTLHEGAMDLVNRVIPRATAEEMRAGLLEAQRYLHSVGVTGWQEAILGDYAGYPEASAAYRTLLDQDLLTGRAAGALWVPRSTTVESVPELVAEFVARREQNAAAGFRTTSAKIMVDGVPENRTAAMLEPYLQPCACEAWQGRRRCLRRPRAELPAQGRVGGSGGGTGRGRVRPASPRDRRPRGARRAGRRRARPPCQRPRHRAPPHGAPADHPSRRRAPLRRTGRHREPAGALGLQRRPNARADRTVDRRGARRLAVPVPLPGGVRRPAGDGLGLARFLAGSLAGHPCGGQPQPPGRRLGRAAAAGRGAVLGGGAGRLYLRLGLAEPP